jgi:hypothetical protein
VQIAHGELLVSDVEPIQTAYGRNVGYKTARSLGNTQLCLASYRTDSWLTVLNEKTLMLRPGARTHPDLDILNARSLPGRPMNTGGSSARRYSSQIEDQIANLPEKDIRRYPTLVTVALILIAVYQT